MRRDGNADLSQHSMTVAHITDIIFIGFFVSCDRALISDPTLSTWWARKYQLRA